MFMVNSDRESNGFQAQVGVLFRTMPDIHILYLYFFFTSFNFLFAIFFTFFSFFCFMFFLVSPFFYFVSCNRSFFFNRYNDLFKGDGKTGQFWGHGGCIRLVGGGGSERQGLFF